MNDTNAQIISVVFPILMLLCAIFILPFILTSLKKSKEIFGENEEGTPQVQNAIIISKRIESPFGSMENFNFVVFEKENGERIELAIKNNEEYTLMHENDKGVLIHQGKKFISFERNIKSDF